MNRHWQPHTERQALMRKITEIELRFPDGQRPITVVKLDGPVLDADMRYAIAVEKEFKVNVFRGECGDYVRCGVEAPPPKGKTEFPKNRYKLMDGKTHIGRALLPTNEVAVNALFRMFDPVMDVIIDDPEQGAIRGHVLADSVAKYLYARYTNTTEPVAPCMAVIEWQSGIRVYEPVMATWNVNENKWEADVNRKDVGDKIVFLATPDDKLTPLLVALQHMGNDDARPDPLT
jgi:hypothetical protein